MTYRELYNRIKTVLKNAGIDDYEFDAKCIFKDTAGLDYSVLPLKETAPDGDICSKALKAAEKRASGYPLQYLLGTWEFYGLPFKVGEGVLIPRPDTETLVDEVIRFVKESNIKNPEIIDLCSGSGCIAVALQKNIPGAKVYAAELSSEAFLYLTHNIKMNGADIKLLKGDVMNGSLLGNFICEDSPGDYRQADCIVSNPPYLTGDEMDNLQTEVAHEPDKALRGGKDGLEFYRVIPCLWKDILKDGGLLAFETGSGQGSAVSGIMLENGYKNVRVIKDLSGNDRVVTGVWSSTN